MNIESDIQFPSYSSSNLSSPVSSFRSKVTNILCVPCNCKNCHCRNLAKTTSANLKISRYGISIFIDELTTLCIAVNLQKPGWTVMRTSNGDYT